MVKVKFFKQDFRLHKELFVTPVIGITWYAKGWSIGIGWLRWSASLCFLRKDGE